MRRSALTVARSSGRSTRWFLDRIHAGTVSYTKYGRVLDLGASGQWDDSLVEGAAPFWDWESRRYGLLYTGYKVSTGVSCLGIAWSTSGTPYGPYSRDAHNPLLAGSGVAGDPDRYGVTGCIPIWDGSTWHIYSIGLDGTGYEGGTPRLCYYTTHSLINPSLTRHGAVISPAGSGWRANKIWIGCLVERAGTKYLMFNATGADNQEKIGVATSSSYAPPWTVDDVNSPVIPNAAGWDSSLAGQPWARRIHSTWVCEFYGFNGTNARDGITTTTDARFPTGWTEYGSNPVLQNGGAGSIDATHAHKPLSLDTPKAIFHFYTAVAADSRRTVALAVAAK